MKQLSDMLEGPIPGKLMLTNRKHQDTFLKLHREFRGRKTNKELCWKPQQSNNQHFLGHHLLRLQDFAQSTRLSFFQACFKKDEVH
jgi:hypothetical protein